MKKLLWNVLPPAMLIIALAFSVYANSVKGGFIWDDVAQVADNEHIKDWSHIPAVFREPMGAGAGYPSPFYRPLQTLTYMADYSLYGLKPAGFHLTNILLHAAAALALYWLARLLFSAHIPALAAAALFVIHPVHTEAVAFISDRAESLSALFMLLSAGLYIRYLRAGGRMRYAAMTAVFSLALLSKESSLILPVLLFCYHRAFKIRLRRHLAGPCLAAGAYLLLRFFLQLPLSPGSSPFSFQRLPGFFAAVAGYAKLMILPFGLHMEYNAEPFRWLDPRVMAGTALFCLLLLYATGRKAGGMRSFSLLWFLAALLPVSNIYPVINDSYMAERWLYFPSIGIFLLAGSVFSLTATKKKLWVVLFAGIMLFYSQLTIRQNGYWIDPVRFYQRTLRYNPRSWKCYNGLGLACSARGDYAAAIRAYTKAAEINPGAAGIYDNLGNAYAASSETEKAAQAYAKAREITAANIRACVEETRKYRDAGEFRKSLESARKAVDLAGGGDAFLLSELGNAYILAGRYGEAVQALQKAVEKGGRMPELLNSLAVAYFYAGRYDLAYEYCAAASASGYRVAPAFHRKVEMKRREKYVPGK